MIRIYKNFFTKRSSNFGAISLSALVTVITLGSVLGFLTPVRAESKPTISVPQFKNETSSWWWRTGTAKELSDALSNELNATGKFSVAERQKLGSVLSEQELAEIGLVQPETGAKKGKLTGAKYIVLGQVTAYEEQVADESSGVGIGGINIGGVRLGGGGNQKKQQAYVAIDLRVVDSTSGEVVHSRTVEGRATSKSKAGSADVRIGGVNVGGNSKKTNRAPVGKALRAALIESTDYLSCVMVDKDSCIEEFDAKEEKRRDETRSVLDLD